MQAFTYELYEILGIFIPLIVTNCAILGRADAFAAKTPCCPLPWMAFDDGNRLHFSTGSAGRSARTLWPGNTVFGYGAAFRRDSENLEVGGVRRLHRLPVPGSSAGSLFGMGLIIASKTSLMRASRPPVKSPQPVQLLRAASESESRAKLPERSKAIRRVTMNKDKRTAILSDSERITRIPPRS